MYTKEELKEVLALYDSPDCQKQIADGIEQNRKGNFFINLKHQKPGKIHVRQIRHKFQFGANLFLLDEMETPEKNQKYKENFTNIFNFATLPIYWDTLEPEHMKPRFAVDSPKVYRRPALDKCVEFCLHNDIHMKAHCLCYDHFIPEWVKSYSIQDYKAALETRYQMLSARYKTVIPEYEVVNETLYWAYDETITELYRSEDYIRWNFALARRYFPKATLYINESSNEVFSFFKGNRGYYEMIKYAVQNGATIDGIGVQSHLMWLAPQKFTPDNLTDCVKKYSEDFHMPVHVTELSIPSVFDGEVDEELQAEFTEKIYKLYFSLPAMDKIVYWNLTDGYAYNAEPGDMTKGENVYGTGLCRFDGSVKKAYEVLDQLINREWHTEFTADTQRELYFRGFYGDYEITLDYEDGTQRIYHTRFDEDGAMFFA